MKDTDRALRRMLQTPSSTGDVTNEIRNQQNPTNTTVPHKKNPTKGGADVLGRGLLVTAKCIRDRQRESAPATQRFVCDSQLSL